MSTHVSSENRGIASINPATGELIRKFEPHTTEEIQGRVELAATTFKTFRKTPLMQRAHFLDRVAEILEAEKDAFGRTMTLEMGKPIRAAIQEVEKCATACRYYAENGTRFLAEEPGVTKETRSYVRYEPLGPVLAIMPWNFPFWQVFRFAVPALMAGNVGLLKHASNVPQCALAIEQIFRRAGFAEGAFQTLLVSSNRAEALIADRRIRAVTLTGSLEAGSKVAAASGRQIKKTVLELGGSDPFIVMPSADLERAARTAAKARTINNGQSCIAAKRFIVHQEIAKEFERRFIKEMSSLKVGDPMEEKTDIGPLATEQVAVDLQRQVEDTLRMGAKLLLGGRRVEGPGFYFAPSILGNIPKGSPAYDGELFGPVASIFHVNSMDEALSVANDSSFGLGACAWTQDELEQKQFIHGIESGMAFINGMVASDPTLPFGGVKQSGYGRELGQHGIREFVNIKTVVIA